MSNYIHNTKYPNLGNFYIAGGRDTNQLTDLNSRIFLLVSVLEDRRNYKRSFVYLFSCFIYHLFCNKLNLFKIVISDTLQIGSNALLNVSKHRENIHITTFFLLIQKHNAVQNLKKIIVFHRFDIQLWCIRNILHVISSSSFKCICIFQI